MTTARTHQTHVGPKPALHRPVAAGSTPDMPLLGIEPAATAVAVHEVDEVVFDPSTLDFDPADHNVDEVKEYVKANPQTADAILELELNGKARSGLMSFLDNFDTDTESEN